MSEQRPKSSKQGTIVILLVIAGILGFGVFHKYAAKMEAERLEKERQVQQETARLQREQAEREAKAKAEAEAKAQKDKEEKEKAEGEARAKEEARVKEEEERYWELLDKTKIGELKAYIAKYPSGAYVDLAKAKIASIEVVAPLGETAHSTSNNSTSNNTKVLEPLSEIDKRMAGDFVPIAPGKFTMGESKRVEVFKSPLSGHIVYNDMEMPSHDVVISRGFEMGKYEVTQEQWELVMGSNPSYSKGDKRSPVDGVSWEDVQQFISVLNSKSRKYIYGLPTEAEWEYACRAGSKGDYAGNLDAMGWYTDNSRGNKPHPVGEKQPNAWGLYDMHGNVSEWCSDWSGDYTSETTTNPRGASSGRGRVIRGGAYYQDAVSCRSASRSAHAPDDRYYGYGFRLVRTQKGL